MAILRITRYACLMAAFFPIAAAAQTGLPAADILGVTLGMTVEEVKSTLTAADPAYKFEEYRQPGVGGELYISQLSARLTTPNPKAPAQPNGTADQSPEMRMQRQMWSQLRGMVEEPKDLVTEEVQVLFSGVPGRNAAISMGRGKVFPRDGAPTVAAIAAALKEKYKGRATTESVSEYDGGVSVVWAFDARNRPIGGSGSDPDLKYSCTESGGAGGGGAGGGTGEARAPVITSFDGRCGLTIAAGVSTWPDNKGLAVSVAVAITDKKAAYDAISRRQDMEKAHERNQRARELERANQKPATKF